MKFFLFIGVMKWVLVNDLMGYANNNLGMGKYEHRKVTNTGIFIS